jgi:hypothetical protein
MGGSLSSSSSEQLSKHRFQDYARFPATLQLMTITLQSKISAAVAVLPSLGPSGFLYVHDRQLQLLKKKHAII